MLIDRSALDPLVAATGGYPYFIQLYGRHAWEAAHGGRITAATVTAAAQSVMAALDAGPYGAAWQRLRPSEQRFVAAMAGG